jgi:hypothetical protein
MKESEIKDKFDKKKQQLISLYGRKALDNVQCKNIGKKLIGKSFLGVYPVDRVPLSRNGYGIINTDTYGNSGIHWCAFYLRGKNIYIYDSFARHTSTVLKILYAKLKQKGIKVINSDLTDSEQRGNSQVCGIISLSWIHIAYKYGINNALKI